MFDKNLLKAAFEEMKAKGIGSFLKNAMQMENIKSMIMSQVLPIWEQFKTRYDVKDVCYDLVDSTFIAEFHVPDEQNREDMVKNMLNFIDSLRSHFLMKLALSEFEIKRMRCYEDNEYVKIEFEGNEKFVDLVESLRGGDESGGEPEQDEEEFEISLPDTASRDGEVDGHATEGSGEEGLHANESNRYSPNGGGDSGVEPASGDDIR